jgi:NAD-specific glutamate dehydrogenase
VPGIGQQAALRLAAHIHGSISSGGHDRRHQRISALVADDERHAVADEGDEAVRGSEIDADDF